MLALLLTHVVDDESIGSSVDIGNAISDLLLSKELDVKPTVLVLVEHPVAARHNLIGLAFHYQYLFEAAGMDEHGSMADANRNFMHALKSIDTLAQCIQPASRFREYMLATHSQLVHDNVPHLCSINPQDRKARPWCQRTLQDCLSLAVINKNGLLIELMTLLGATWTQDIFDRVYASHVAVPASDSISEAIHHFFPSQLDTDIRLPADMLSCVISLHRGSNSQVTSTAKHLIEHAHMTPTQQDLVNAAKTKNCSLMVLLFEHYKRALPMEKKALRTIISVTTRHAPRKNTDERNLADRAQTWLRMMRANESSPQRSPQRDLVVVGHKRRRLNQDRKGPFPCSSFWEVCCAGGHLAVLQWARSQGCPSGLLTCTVAARVGSLQTLQWVHAQGHALHSKEVYTVVVERGDLEMLRWIHSQGYYLPDTICDGAAKAGHLEVLQWARSKYCVCNEWTCRQAARGGHLEVLQYLHAQGCPWDGRTCTAAAEGGHLELLQWARAQGCRWDRHTCALAAKGGHLEVLRWVRSQGCPWDETTCARAALGGHLEVLQWARAQGCPWDTWTCAEAAAGGHLAVLQWARSQGCPWDHWTCTQAASAGHMDVLQWAHMQGCPWDKLTCSAAAARGRIEILRWLRAQGCPWGEDTCNVAVERGRLEILRWAISQGCPIDQWTCAAAARGGHLEVLQLLHGQGCPWNEWTCSAAAGEGHLEVLQWARAQGCPWDAWTCMGAARRGHLEVLQWARSQGCPE